MLAQLKRKFLSAVLLGLLTFVITPIIAIVLSFPFYLFNKIPENVNPLIIISGIFWLTETGGFFASQFILVVFIGLLGDFTTAIISRSINRSLKFAILTFISALIFQFLSLVLIIPATANISQETMKTGIENEIAFRDFAKIGNVRYEILEPYSNVEMDNPHPEFGQVYKTLVIVIPVTISKAGVYQIDVLYSFSKAGERGSTSIKTVTDIFTPGENSMQVKFLANEISGYGFWTPSSVSGIAEIQLSCLASVKELQDKINLNTTTDNKIREQLLKDEEKINRKLQTKTAIIKFVERKEIQF